MITDLQENSDQSPAYISLETLSKRSGLSIRTLRTLIHSPTHPLPAYRVGGKILVRWNEFTHWIEQFRIQPTDIDGWIDQFTCQLQGSCTNNRVGQSLDHDPTNSHFKGEAL